MKIRHFLVSVISVIGFGLTVPASATILTATYTGTVSYGTGYIGAFGADGSTLAGKTFTSVYTYDTSLGYYGAYNQGGYNQNYVYGGSYYGNASPMLSAFLTIDGNALGFNGGPIGQIFAEQDASYNQVSHAAYSDYNYNSQNNSQSFTYLNSGVYGYAGAINPALPLDLNTAYSWDPSMGGYGYGGAGSYGHTNSNQYDWYLGFSNTSLNVTLGDTTNVPEPSSIALLGVGLAGLGFVRRKKQKAA